MYFNYYLKLIIYFINKIHGVGELSKHPRVGKRRGGGRGREIACYETSILNFELYYNNNLFIWYHLNKIIMNPLKINNNRIIELLCINLYSNNVKELVLGRYRYFLVLELIYSYHINQKCLFL